MTLTTWLLGGRFSSCRSKHWKKEWRFQNESNFVLSIIQESEMKVLVAFVIKTLKMKNAVTVNWYNSKVDVNSKKKLASTSNQ